eukprot:bmy_19912T0
MHRAPWEWLLYSMGPERTEACEELLRIEEDAHWPSEGIISSSKDQDMNIAMIEQLREAVDLLQDPNRLSTDITERSVVNFYPVDSAEDLELQDSALNGQIQLETSPECEVRLLLDSPELWCNTLPQKSGHHILSRFIVGWNIH